MTLSECPLEGGSFVIGIGTLRFKYLLHYRLGGALVEMMETTEMMKAKAAKVMEAKATMEVMKAKAAVVKNLPTEEVGEW